MSGKNFNEPEKQKLIQIIREGSQVLGEIHDLKGGLRDTVKAIAEEMDLKPGVLMKAVKVAHKAKFQDEFVKFDELETILETVGKTL